MCNTLWTPALSIISSINPHEQQELALEPIEGCTYHIYLYISICAVCCSRILAIKKFLFSSPKEN
jgi:hypothetical protein